MSQNSTIVQRAPPQFARRSWRHPSTILITGASGGIGAALSRSYAQAGCTLILHGRDASRLQCVARECELRGAVVHGVTFDLRDAEAAIATLRSLSDQYPIDLAIINAGVSRSVREGTEEDHWEATRAVLAVNLDGAIATIAGVLPDMRRRGAGQIAIISSLSAVLRLAAHARILREQGCHEGLWRGVARLAGTARNRRQCGAARLCQNIDERPVSGTETVVDDARSSGDADPARPRAQ